MKKYLGILVVLCMLTTLLIPGFALAAENILDNGGLETGDTTGWTTYPPGNFASGNIAISAVAEAAHTGSYGLKLETTANTPAWSNTGAYLTVAGSKIDLSKEYVLSCYVKSADGKNRKLRLAAMYRNAATDGLYTYASDFVTVGAEWQKLSLTMAAGNMVLTSEQQAEMYSMEVYVQNPITEESAGIYYADDMEMTEIEDVQTVSNSISVGEHGKVTIAGKDYTGESQLTDLMEGGTLQFTVVPDEGYEVDTVTYNGARIGAGSTVTVAADAALCVTFGKRADGNLVENCGFESGHANGWAVYPPNGWGAWSELTQEAARTGVYSLKIRTENNVPDFDHTGAYLSLMVDKMNPSKAYEASAWLKSADGKNHDIKIYAVYRNQATDALKGLVSDTAVTITPDEWKQVSFTIDEVLSDAYVLEICFANPNDGSNNGSYYLDDCSIAEQSRIVSNTVSVGEHGKVTIAGKDYTGESQIDGLTAGEPLSYTVTPDEGYEIDTITYNGVSLSEGMEPTVTADGTLTVTFRVKAPVLPSVTQNGTAIVSEDYDGTGYTAKTFYFSSVIPTGWTADGYGAYLTDDIASGNMIQLEGRVITNGQFAIRVFGDAVQNTKYFMKGYLTDGTNEYTGDWQSSN